MIRSGESIFTSLDSDRIACVICGRALNIRNGYDRAIHGRGHVNSGQATESMSGMRDGRHKYEYTLTERGAAAANLRLVRGAA